MPVPETWQHLIYGFGVALQPENLGLALAGAVIGTIVGVLPGIGPGGGIAILLPLAFKLSPSAALILLTALYYVTMYGGSPASILLNLPRDATPIAPTVGRYQMGRPGRTRPACATA